jgi:DNA-binding MarR family transcriptional regulator
LRGDMAAERASTARKRRLAEAEERGSSEAGGSARARSRPVRAASQELDRLIHERVRLAILSALAVNDTLSFNDLKTLLGTTDGNLSVHARKLEDAGYVECEKSFQGRLPRTEYRLAPAGRQALEEYLEHMEALIRAVRDE